MRFLVFFIIGVYFSYLQVGALVSTLWLKNTGTSIIDVTETLSYEDKEAIKIQSQEIQEIYGVKVFTVTLQSRDEESTKDLGNRIIRETIQDEKSLLFIYEKDKDLWSYHKSENLQTSISPLIINELWKSFIKKEALLGSGEALRELYTQINKVLGGDILSRAYYNPRIFFSIFGVLLVSCTISGYLFISSQIRRNKGISSSLKK